MTTYDCHTEVPHYIAARIPWRAGPGACCVYRLYDLDGDLLYVGITVDLIARMSAHKQTPHFRAQVGFVEWEEWDSAVDALAEEVRLIGEHNPPWNIRGRTDAVVWPPPPKS